MYGTCTFLCITKYIRIITRKWQKPSLDLVITQSSDQCKMSTELSPLQENTPKWWNSQGSTQQGVPTRPHNYPTVDIIQLAKIILSLPKKTNLYVSMATSPRYFQPVFVSNRVHAIFGNGFSHQMCVCVFQRCFRYRYPSCVRRMAPNQVPGVVDMIRDILWLLYCWIYREQYRKYMENNMLWIGFNLQFSYVSSFILATQPTWPIIKKTHPGSWKGHFVHPKHKPPHGPPDHKCWLVEEMMPQPFLVFFCLPGSRHV
jgi:hypothetical protein